jgi:hypothetical protein
MTRLAKVTLVQPGNRHCRSRRITSGRWALGVGVEPSDPALVHGVPDVVVEGDDDGGVTGNPLHRLAIDQAAVSELADEDAQLT